MRWTAGLLAIAIAALPFAGGCGGTCDISDEGNPPEIFAGGAVSATGMDYASSSPLGPFLYFPGGKQYQLVHHLGFTPNTPIIYFSFAANDDRVSPCSGNSCEILCFDDQVIWVKNDTCTEFWIRVAASGSSPQSVPRCRGDNIDGGASAVNIDGAPEAAIDDASDAALTLDVAPPDDSAASDASGVDP
jgi:hypothetical protein